MKIGIFGGTFDPPHIGHLIVAQDACEQLRLDRVLFVPAARPPHKLDRAVSPADVRVELLRAALGEDRRFHICELELMRAGPSYTVDTLRELRARQPGDDFFLLLGADQVRELDTWREPDVVATLARVVLVAREGVTEQPTQGGRVSDAIEVTRIDVSATEIRERIAAGRSIRYLVPDAVERMIHQRNLYRSAVASETTRPARG